MKLKLTALLLLATIFSFGQIVKNQEWEFTNTVTLGGNVVIPTGASNGDVLTSDGSGNATWQASGSGAVQSATVTLSSADILSLHTTPVTLVAAQGAGTVIVPIRITAYLDYNSVPYATDVLTRICIDPTGISAIYGTLTLTGNTDDVVQSITGATLSISGSISTLFNSPLVAFAPTSNPTAGNSSVKFNILYSVINL